MSKPLQFSIGRMLIAMALFGAATALGRQFYALANAGQYDAASHILPLAIAAFSLGMGSFFSKPASAALIIGMILILPLLFCVDLMADTIIHR